MSQIYLTAVGIQELCTMFAYLSTENTYRIILFTNTPTYNCGGMLYSAFTQPTDDNYAAVTGIEQPEADFGDCKMFVTFPEAVFTFAGEHTINGWLLARNAGSNPPLAFSYFPTPLNVDDETPEIRVQPTLRCGTCLEE